jgi:hypothetical protein
MRKPLVWLFKVGLIFKQPFEQQLVSLIVQSLDSDGMQSCFWKERATWISNVKYIIIHGINLHD